MKLSEDENSPYREILTQADGSTETHEGERRFRTPGLSRFDTLCNALPLVAIVLIYYPWLPPAISIVLGGTALAFVVMFE